ncbi:MAG: hypothetical protein WCD13_17320, partial [Pseudolabrys sp.]
LIIQAVRRVVFFSLVETERPNAIHLVSYLVGGGPIGINFLRGGSVRVESSIQMISKFGACVLKRRSIREWCRAHYVAPGKRLHALCEGTTPVPILL